MKVIALWAAAVLVAAAWAQQPAKPAAQEAPKAAVATKAEPPKADTVAKSEPRKPRKYNPRRQEDARHCLEKATNTEIIKCAEAYL
jgi:hypothetical protein